MQHTNCAHIFTGLIISFFLIKFWRIFLHIPIQVMLLFDSMLVNFNIYNLIKFKRECKLTLSQSRVVQKSSRFTSFLNNFDILHARKTSEPVPIQNFFVMAMVLTFSWLCIIIQLVFQNVKRDTSVTFVISPVPQAHLVSSVAESVYRGALKKSATMSMDVQII